MVVVFRSMTEETTTSVKSSTAVKEISYVMNEDDGGISDMGDSHSPDVWGLMKELARGRSGT